MTPKELKDLTLEQLQQYKIDVLQNLENVMLELKRRGIIRPPTALATITKKRKGV